MEVLWSSDQPSTLRSVREGTAQQFPARRARGLTSVHSMLETLSARGYVEIDRTRGRRIRYRPVMGRSEALAGAAETLVDEFCEFHPGDGWYLVHAFLSGIDLEDLPPAEGSALPAAERPARRWSGHPSC